MQLPFVFQFREKFGKEFIVEVCKPSNKWASISKWLLGGPSTSHRIHSQQSGSTYTTAKIYNKLYKSPQNLLY